MSERIPMRYTVALEGFDESERDAVAELFPLAEQRAPTYVEAASTAGADFIVANADHPGCAGLLAQAGRLQDTVFIGKHTPTGAGARLMRPITPAHIVRELDGLLEQRLASLDEPVDTNWVASGPDDLMNADGTPSKDVLVVDDSRVALKFLQVRLQRRGYRVHLARDGAEALERLGAQSFSLVFLDIALGPPGGMDGLALCQHIKQRKTHPDGLVPAVLMVTGKTSSADRVRGDLAGCDAYLTKPLMEDEFDAALRLLDPDHPH